MQANDPVQPPAVGPAVGQEPDVAAQGEQVDAPPPAAPGQPAGPLDVPVQEAPINAEMAQQQHHGAFHANVPPIPEGQEANLALVGHACIRPVIQAAFKARTSTDGLFARKAARNNM